VILHAAADLRVAAFGSYEKVRRPLGPQAEMEIKGKSGGVKRWPQVGGGRWERQAQRAI
jgi:hypothetical protein